MLQSCLPQQSDAYALHAVFVHENNFKELCDALLNASKSFATPRAVAEKMEIAGCENLISNIFRVNLGTMATEPKKTLRAIRENRALLIADCSSQDHIVDVLGKVDSLGTLAMVGAVSEASRAYIETWTRSTVFSTSGIQPVAAPSKSCVRRQIHCEIPLINPSHSSCAPTWKGITATTFPNRYVHAPSIADVW